ncbi:MAG TPA: hypothetical protein VEX35_01535 [Allosphingosinicella sp.]|nr:hypothetical protein [Allosphingosinicella sp.]
MESLLGERGEAYRQYLRQSLMSGALLMTMMGLAARGHKTLNLDLEDAALDTAEEISPAFRRSVQSALTRGRVSKPQINSLNREIQKAIVSAGYGDGPTWQASDSFTIFGQSLLPSTKENAFFASLSGLKLVDVKATSWERIIEFRKDAGAKAALRDLRLFFEADLAGKEAAQVEDILLSRIYHHDEVVRGWGFETLNRAMGVLFSKESALPAVGAISAAILGAPLAAAAAGAAVFAIGSCAVEVGRATIEKRKAHLENPVRYLTDLKAKLN